MKKNDLASTKSAPAKKATKSTPSAPKASTSSSKPSPTKKQSPSKNPSPPKPKKGPVEIIPEATESAAETETVAAGDVKALLAGTKPAKMDPELLESFAVNLLGQDLVDETKAKFDATKIRVQFVKMIGAYYAARPMIELAKCWKCSLRSDIQYDTCPACGEGEEPKKKSSIIGDKPPVETPESKFTTEDLDAKLSRVRTVLGDVNLSFWHLGSELQELQETQIWKLRKDETGKPQFKSFAAFVEAEFKFSGKWAANVISVRTSFTQEQIATVGPTKLGILLKLDEPSRASLLPQAAEISKRDLEAKVREQNSAEGESTEDSPAPTKSKKSQVLSDDPKITTIVLPTDVTKIPLYQKTESQELATDIHQGPWGMYESNNGTTIMFRLRLGPNAEYILELEPIREA